MKILLKNAMIITMNANEEVYSEGNILVEDDKISKIGYFEMNEDPDEVVDCKGKIVMPGLVNTHVHTSQQLGRGLGDDVNLLTWLHDRIWPYESNMTEEDSYVSTLACCLEQIKCGCTSFAEPGGQHVSGMVRGVAKAGIRAKLAKSVMDCGEGLPKVWQKTADEELDKQEEDLKKFHNTYDGRVKVWFGLRTIFNNTDDLIVRTKEMADKYGVGVHMHVAEIRDEVEYVKATRGDTTVTHLNKLGVLDKNFLAVHTVWLSNEEVEMFRDHEVKVSHNPAAAMRVLGFAKVPRMLRDRMDMVDEMYLTSLIHKGWRLEPDVVKAQEIIRMATINGAKALMDEDLYGSLEVGKKADLIVINPDSVGMLPCHDAVANVVTSMHSSNVESTMCDGKWLMKDRIVLSMNEEEVLEAAKEHAAAIRSRAGIVLPDRFPVIYPMSSK